MKIPKNPNRTPNPELTAGLKDLLIEPNEVVIPACTPAQSQEILDALGRRDEVMKAFGRLKKEGMLRSLHLFKGRPN